MVECCSPKAMMVVRIHLASPYSHQMLRYSTKDVGQSVKLLSYDWLGAIPRRSTIYADDSLTQYKPKVREYLRLGCNLQYADDGQSRGSRAPGAVQEMRRITVIRFQIQRGKI